MNTRSIRRSAGVLACAAPLLASAQQAAPSASVAQLDTIVVTASRTPQELKNVLSDTSVIDRETLSRAGQSSLAEVLSRSHGIEYVNNGGPQTATSLFMRGANSNQTLVLIDGQRINNASSGIPALNAIPADSIERIEIVRGAASSLYGADAIGGVINVITRQASDKPLSAYSNIGFGTYGTSSYNAGISGASNGWTYSLSGGYQQSHGFDATTTRNPFSHNPDKDSYYQNNVAGSLGYEWKPEQKLSVQVYQTRVNGGYDNGEPYFNDRSVQKLENYSITSENRLADFWKSTLRVGYMVDDNESRNAPADLSPGNSPDGRTTFRTRQNQYSWQNDFRLAENQKFTLAYEHLDQRVKGDIADFTDFMNVTYGDYSQTRRHVNSFTGVYLGDFGRHHVQASLRNDNVSEVGHRTTGGLAYGFDLTGNLRATVAANTGFRAPSFNDLYYPDIGGYVGNPRLKPEESRNGEIGLKYQDDTSELGVVYYHTRVKNLIQTQALDPSNPFAGSTLGNVGRATLQGFTVSGAHSFGNTRIRASLDLSNPKNDDTNEQLLRRARTVLRTSIDHRFDQLLVGAEWYVSDERYDVGQTYMAGYGLFNLTASYDITRNFQVQVRWNNVFDKHYTLAEGYATPGSNAFVNLSWRM
ncbi:TonB-dependent receptor [Achromobacter veterisilvae]|jgi:vitamin B12 transporter|uniref:TonB-dependent receptor n=1 Tax=Achromobacter veterisilvae TaxID=2069367 RepID=A0ABZ2S510_9BURK